MRSDQERTPQSVTFRYSKAVRVVLGVLAALGVLNLLSGVVSLSAIGPAQGAEVIAAGTVQVALFARLAGATVVADQAGIRVQRLLRTRFVPAASIDRIRIMSSTGGFRYAPRTVPYVATREGGSVRLTPMLRYTATGEARQDMQERVAAILAITCRNSAGPESVTAAQV